MVNSDKCYENREWTWGYRETDRLGGFDPYSMSKACQELVVSSYRRALFGSVDESEVRLRPYEPAMSWAEVTGRRTALSRT